MDSACPSCPIGGRDGSGPVCPHVEACDRQCAELVAVHDVRCGLRRDLMEAAEGYTDTPGPLETIRQRWDGGPAVAHTGTTWADSYPDPTSVRLARPGATESPALWAERFAYAPADVAWLLGEVARLRAALIATEHDVCQTLGAALGYPHDPGPDGEPDPSAGICVGDHVAASLAMEAAERLRP